MARHNDLVLNFERMWREIDEFFGESRGESWPPGHRPQRGFVPRVDVYYCGEPDAEGTVAAKAVVKADLAGIRLESVNLEVTGRKLSISGTREVQETEGRAYQQLEIETGRFRRVVEFSADVDADHAKASYSDGILHVELPLRQRKPGPQRVPIEGQQREESR